MFAIIKKLVQMLTIMSSILLFFLIRQVFVIYLLYIYFLNRDYFSSAYKLYAYDFEILKKEKNF